MFRGAMWVASRVRLILMQHHEWASKLAHKFGNAAVMGAGATFGADLVNDAMRKF